MMSTVSLNATLCVSQSISQAQSFVPFDNCCLDKYKQGIPWKLEDFKLIKLSRLKNEIIGWRSVTESGKLFYSELIAFKSSTRHISRKTFSIPVSLGNSSLKELEETSDTSSEGPLAKPLSSDELNSLIMDSERTKLIKKLSEANQHSRFLKRQLQDKEEALVDFKTEIADMEQELQALVAMVEEIGKYGIPKGSRKINGKYIQSHVASRLKAIHGKLKEQVKNVDVAQSQKVALFWSGMAESVQVMGTFDGWSQGEHMSPEYTGSISQFSTTLMLRRGRYEIKFLIDGEWRLSAELPTVGEGPMKNNLLVVE